MQIVARFLFLFALAGVYAFKGQARQPFRLAYFHNGKSIDLHRAAHLSFSPLAACGHLPVMDRRGPYLFRLDLSENPSGQSTALFIENEHLDTVCLYVRRGDSLVLLGRQGNDLVSHNNRLGYPEFLLPGPESTYYLKATFQKDVSLPIHIGSQTGLDASLRSVFFQLGLYYGACLLFFLFNILLFINLRDRSFLYYCFFQFFIVGSVAYADGLFPLIISWPWLLDHADLPLHLGMAWSGSLFASALLEIPAGRNVTRIDLILLTLVLLAFTGSTLSGSYLLFLSGEAATFLLLLYFWGLGLCQFKERPYARFFVFGYGVFLLFAVDYFLLRKTGIFWLDWFPAQLKAGSAIEMLVLSVAIISRMKLLQEENMHYRREIGRYVQLTAQQKAVSAVGSADLFERIRVKYALTDRELQVLQGIAEGLTNQEIAARIFLSVHTVKFHTRNIFDKMEITNRTQALSRLHEQAAIGLKR
jgi:DNA-binding CsgD family transcriptional regulator